MSKTYSIQKDFHSKKEIDIWVLKLNRENRLTRENFTALKTEIQKRNGYYSRYSKGFVFESQPSENILIKIDTQIETLLSQQEQTQPEEINYRPLPEKLNAQYNSYRMFKANLNNDYEINLRNLEYEMEKTNLDINNLPALVKEALDKYQSKLKEYYERRARANLIYPNPEMTGKSNYKNMQGKKAKANRTEKIGIEKVEYAEKRLKITIKNYVKSQNLKSSNKLSFEDENLNQEIRILRSRFRVHKLIIKKAFGISNFMVKVFIYNLMNSAIIHFFGTQGKRFIQNALIQ